MTKRLPKYQLNRMQASLDEVIHEVTSLPAMLTTLLEIKLRRRRIRVNSDERAVLRKVCERFARTRNPAHLSFAFERKRAMRIRLRVTDRDIDRVLKVYSDSVDGTVTSTIRVSARRLAPEVRKDARQYAEQMGLASQVFQARLMRTWRIPLTRFDEFRHLAGHIAELATESLARTRAFRRSRLANALSLLHARACTVAGEIAILMKGGFADGALARWRTLHEIAVVAAFLAEHGEPAAESYMAHFAVQNAKAAHQYEMYRRRLGMRALGRKVLARIDSDVEAVVASWGTEFKKEYGWAARILGKTKPNFSDIEESLQLEMLRPYVKLSSEQVHGGVRGAILRTGLIQQNSRRVELLAGPSNYGFADAGQRATESLLLATASLATLAPTVDSNVLLLILVDWQKPIQNSFAKAQLEIEERHAAIVRKRRPLRRKQYFKNSTHSA